MGIRGRERTCVDVRPARHDVLARRVDLLRALDVEARADGGHLAVLDGHIAHEPAPRRPVSSGLASCWASTEHPVLQVPEPAHHSSARQLGAKSGWQKNAN